MNNKIKLISFAFVSIIILYFLYYLIFVQSFQCGKKKVTYGLFSAKIWDVYKGKKELVGECKRIQFREPLYTCEVEGKKFSVLLYKKSLYIIYDVTDIPDNERMAFCNGKILELNGKKYFCVAYSCGINKL